MSKTAALRIRIDPDLHRRFLDTCKAHDVAASQVLRDFIRQFVSTHEQSAQMDFFRKASGFDRAD